MLRLLLERRLTSISLVGSLEEYCQAWESRLEFKQKLTNYPRQHSRSKLLKQRHRINGTDKKECVVT